MWEYLSQSHDTSFTQSDAHDQMVVKSRKITFVKREGTNQECMSHHHLVVHDWRWESSMVKMTKSFPGSHTKLGS
jgi:hypothetical protein